MKKKVIILLVLICSLFLTGCGRDYTIKSEYRINDIAMIDDLEVKLSFINFDNDILEVVFDIKNNTNNTYTIGPDSFKMYDINKVAIKNNFSNDNSVIKKGETISYTLQYAVERKELYEIYFYSGYVNNNIKFVIDSSDLNY